MPISSTTTGGMPTVTIAYKKFGVKLRFTPTVLANGVISLKLEPEVSDLDPTLTVSSGGVAVPGIIMRRPTQPSSCATGRPSRSPACCTLNRSAPSTRLPWLGSVPMIGALFSSKEFQQDETELVVIVSPHLIHPLPPSAKLKTPLDTSLAANDVDFFLQNRTEIPKTPPTYVTPNGAEQLWLAAWPRASRRSRRTRSVGLGRRDESHFFSCGRGFWPRLAGCSNEYFERKDTVTFSAGDAVAWNAAQQIPEPEPKGVTTRTSSPMGKTRRARCGVTLMVVKNGSTIRAMSCRIACFLLRLQVGVARGPAAARRTNIVDRLDIFWVASGVDGQDRMKT